MYFPTIHPIRFEGLDSRNPLAFRWYDEKLVVAGKTMREHLRFAVCYWHTFRWTGSDPFGGPTKDWPWLKNSNPMQQARDTLDAAFELYTKLGVPFYTFHDRDIAPEGPTIEETEKNLWELVKLAKKKQEETG